MATGVDGGQAKARPQPDFLACPSGPDDGAGRAFGPEATLARVPLGVVVGDFKPMVFRFLEAVVPDAFARTSILQKWKNFSFLAWFQNLDAGLAKG